jgi:hypothetical protein
MSALQHKFNGSQLAAIKSCLKTEGLTLIQGPPGTGKSRTILGVISVITCCMSKRNGPEPMPQKLKDEILAENRRSVI